MMYWDTGKCGEMWGDAWRCGGGFEKCGVEYWDTGKCGEMCGDVLGYGKVWGNMR